MSPASTIEERVLIIAPIGADAANTRELLKGAGFAALACPDVPEAIKKIAEGCGALVMTEEAMADPSSVGLAAALNAQPPWSDLPIVLIASGGESGGISTAAVKLLGPRSNVTLVERPLRTTSLVTTLKAALQARRRQYEVRNLLEEREKLLNSLEVRVNERTAKLRETISELEAFSYSISHDLRAPLRAMQSFAAILDEDCKNVGAEGRDYIRRIITSAARMDRLIQDILTLSRAAQADQPLERVDLDKLVRGIVESYPQFNGSRARIEISGRLPPVLGNEAALTQCISNLLGNAVKFVAFGMTPSVRIRAVKSASYVHLFFKDNGIGISRDAQKKIFGIFQKGNTSYEGTGIGLAIVRKSVERMAGKVTVVSKSGRGSTFCLELKRIAE